MTTVLKGYKSQIIFQMSKEIIEACLSYFERDKTNQNMVFEAA